MPPITINYQTRLSTDESQRFFEFLSHQFIIQKQLSIELLEIKQSSESLSKPLLYGAFFTKNLKYAHSYEHFSPDSSGNELSEACFQFENNTICQPIDSDTYQVHFIHQQSFPEGGFAEVNPLIGTISFSKTQFIQDSSYPARVVKCQDFSKGSLESEYQHAKNIPYLNFQKPIITPGKYFAIMNRCAGKELFDLLTDEVKFRILPIDLRIDLTRELLSQLYEINKIGIIHADIKPENIIVDLQVSPIRVYYIDFGIAITLPAGAESVQHNMDPGTVPYAPIEVLKGHPIQTMKRDIFSLGRVLQLLWGFQADDSYGRQPIFDQTDVLLMLPDTLSKPGALFNHIDDMPSILIIPIQQWLISMLHPDLNSRPSIQQAMIDFNHITESYVKAESWSNWIWTQTPTPIQKAFSWLIKLVSTEEDASDHGSSMDESMPDQNSRPESLALELSEIEEEQDDLSSSPFALLGPPTDSPDTITIWAEQNAYAFRGFRRISQPAVNQDNAEQELLVRP